MTITKAVAHNKRFVVLKQSNGRGHSTYVIQLIKRNGKLAKRQIAMLADQIFITVGDANHAIRMWDLGYTKPPESNYQPPTLRLQEAN